MMKWQGHIVSDPNILMGKPTIKGTRISVELILELLASGWSEKSILESYPQLSRDAILAVYSYVKDVAQHYEFPLPKSA